ncbi:MAG TPA: hypothetical protein VKK61_08610 [Tepidisphaeraceae bacterium]|nr:hypothetical protein [Tepidisphaeraceae bacterium]
MTITRPWLLLPKIIAFCVYVGGLATVLGFWIASDFTLLDLADPRRQLVLDQMGRVLVFLVVPALLATILFGILLLIHTPQLLRMRWMRVKLISLIILIPASHFFCETRFSLIRHASDRSRSDSLAHQLTIGFVVSFAWAIWIVVLGRLKPRLGQTHGGAVGVMGATSSSRPSTMNP